jgi:anaerobic ribonucleoside-triphosphate reductase activating protein
MVHREGTQPAAAVLRVGARVPVTRAEGPGVRYAVWVQGCSIRCAGCCNPQMFDPVGGRSVPVSTLLGEIAAQRGVVEGITVLGGEPFDQPAGLAALVRGAARLALSTMVFTGYVVEELRARHDADVAALLAAIDLLVDGRYEAARPELERLWVGSTNQRFHYLTGRYTPAIERPRPGEPLRTVEVHLGADGRLSANGWPDAGLLLRLLHPGQQYRPRQPRDAADGGGGE